MIRQYLPRRVPGRQGTQRKSRGVVIKSDCRWAESGFANANCHITCPADVDQVPKDKNGDQAPKDNLSFSFFFCEKEDLLIC
jgi:hypothetical protein